MINDIASSVRAGKCVLFLGTGFHAPAPPGLPWNYPAAIAPPFGGDPSQKLADESDFLLDYPQGNPREVSRVAMHYEVKLCKGRQALFNKVRAEVEVGKRPSPILRAFAELNFPIWRECRECLPEVIPAVRQWWEKSESSRAGPLTGRGFETGRRVGELEIALRIVQRGEAFAWSWVISAVWS